MLGLQEALLIGMIADLDTGEKVVLYEAGGCVFKPGPIGGWLKQGFEQSALFVGKINQIYNYRKQIIYSNRDVETFIPANQQSLRDLPLYDDEDDVTCRECGCSYYSPCYQGCYWVEPDLCSECVKVE